MTDEQIDVLIARRAKLTNRRDEWVDWKRVDAIDAKLSAACPDGQHNDVDLLLGRSCATLPKRIDGDHLHQCGWCGEWYTGARVDHGCPEPEQYQSKRVVMVKHIGGEMEVEAAWSDQTEDYLDWIASRGDCTL